MAAHPDTFPPLAVLRATPSTLADAVISHPGRVVLVDLDEVDWSAVGPPPPRGLPGLLVGRSSSSLPVAARQWIETFTLTLAPGGPGNAWVDAPVEPVLDGVSRFPRAAAALSTLLPVTSRIGVEEGLVTESFAYSMLLAGQEFGAWRDATPRRHVSDPSDPVALVRDGDHLVITLDNPARRNAFGRSVRDGLLEALELVSLDTSISYAELRGAGPSFCSGGDLDEFGTTSDPTDAHVHRLTASAGAAVYRLRGRIRPVLHGACVGAGIEVPAFADEIAARPDAWFQLPELRFGLVPGAGGTVSLTRRIGRWRTAWMCLSGERVDARRGLEWGLVDEIVD